MVEDKAIQSIMRLVRADLSIGLGNVIDEVSRRWMYYTAYTDLGRNSIYLLEKEMNLTGMTRQEIRKTINDVYKEEKKPYNFALPQWERDATGKLIQVTAGVTDANTLDFLNGMNDFYLGKFFQGDQNIRKDVLNWMNDYYIQKGNPLGKGQAGAREFLEKFKEQLSIKTEWKAAQIIDTTVSFTRNSARIRGMSSAGITEYRVDAVGDRRTCATCRGLDGRIFKTQEAAKQLDDLEKADFSNLTEKRPILSGIITGPSDDVQVKFSPFHPKCHCKVVANFIPSNAKLGEVSVPPGAIRNPELVSDYSSLSKEERYNKMQAHLGSEWARIPNSIIEKKKAEKWGKFNGEYIKDHYTKHVTDKHEDLGVKDEFEYRKLTERIIKKPDSVYVERDTKGSDVYIFRRGKIMVASADESLSIASCYEREVNEWIQERQTNKKSSIIRIL